MGTRINKARVLPVGVQRREANRNGHKSNDGARRSLDNAYVFQVGVANPPLFPKLHRVVARRAVGQRVKFRLDAHPLDYVHFDKIEKQAVHQQSKAEHEQHQAEHTPC